MQIAKQTIRELNEKVLAGHLEQLKNCRAQLSAAEKIIDKIRAFQIAIPSWALGTGGTRFGRFPLGGEPSSLEEKIEDIGLLHALSGSCGAISLHIPWDIPRDPEAIRKLAEANNLKFDAVNSNTFQDQPGQVHSYKFGSLHHVDPEVRKQAIEHNLAVIRIGKSLGCQALSLWLSDGSSFPGQLNFREAFERTLDSLQQIYRELPEDWKIYLEYKAFEPNFYSMTIGDWGQSYLLASKLGEKALTLVDLGHHLPNANIEQIVALLMMEKKLAGFHFNDSKYGDDDLTAGSIRPYQLFLIFRELVDAMDHAGLNHSSALAWMIDASHNIKDPLEDLLQSLDSILNAYAKALLVDSDALREAQQKNDVAGAEEILHAAYLSDVRPLLAEARRQAGAAIRPLESFRILKVRETLIRTRGKHSTATGL